MQLGATGWRTAGDFVGMFYPIRFYTGVCTQRRHRRSGPRCGVMPAGAVFCLLACAIGSATGSSSHARTETNISKTVRPDQIKPKHHGQQRQDVGWLRNTRTPRVEDPRRSRRTATVSPLISFRTGGNHPSNCRSAVGQRDLVGTRIPIHRKPLKLLSRQTPLRPAFDAAATWRSGSRVFSSPS